MSRRGQTHRDLAISLGLVALFVGLLALAAHWIEGSRFAHGQELIPPRPLPVIPLRAATGQELTSDRWHGKWRLLYFGYTYCPDICPAALANLARTLNRLGARGRKVQVVFISLDSARDTPVMADRFARYFHPNFTGCTTSEKQAARLIRAAGTPFPFAGDASTADAPDPTRHPAQYFLVDPSDRLVAKYADDVTPNDLAGDLADCLGQ